MPLILPVPVPDHRMLPAHAAVAVAGAEHEEQLRAAVGSRDAKLTDVAAELTDTGAVPTGGHRRD